MREIDEDDIFELAELACVAASKNSSWKELHEHFTKLANVLDRPGRRHRKVDPKMTQKQKLINHFKLGKTISQLEARHLYNIQSLSSRISELKVDGHVISSTLKYDVTGSVYARYTLNVS